jgi:hypothetical protein
MATTTFDKRIVIDDEAADRLIAVLNKPAPPRPKQDTIRWVTEEDMECYRRARSARLSEQKTNEKS